MSESINYSTDSRLSDNSYNECLTVQQDGFSIHLRPLLDMGLFQPPRDRLDSHEEAAEYLWAAFPERLRH